MVLMARIDHFAFNEAREPERVAHPRARLTLNLPTVY